MRVALKKKQLKFRGFVLKNMENELHPANLIKKLEKRVVKAVSKYNKSASSVDKFHIEITKKQSLNKRASKLVDIWNEIGAKIPEEIGVKISKDIDKLKILESQIKIEKEIIKLKGKVLNVLKKNGDDISLKSAESIEYIKITDRAMILEKATKANPALAKTLASKLDELSEIEKLTKDWVAKGKVHPFFDWWATVSARYARYWIMPETSNNKALKWVENNMRVDRIKLPDGTVEKVIVKGEHAKTAIIVGASDIAGDIVTQIISRSVLLDPEERIWGTGDNFLEFMPWKGGTYGVHFDLIGTTLNNIYGWALGMPMGFARLQFQYGSKGQVTYLRKFWDSQIKSIPNLPWSIINTYPMWLIAGGAVLADYKMENADNFDEEAYSVLKDKISGRLFSSKGIGERLMFNKTIGNMYINPQYWIQTEFDQVVTSLTGSTLLGKIVSGVVMPITTGFYYHKWWGDYFGFNNPKMIEVLRKFQLDGILDKIDKEGYTRPELWSEYEKSGFLNLISILEMARYEKESPITTTMSAEEIANWYSNVFANIFGDIDIENLDVNKIPDKVKIIASPNSGQVTDTFRYMKEVSDLLELFSEVRKNTTLLPFVHNQGNALLGVRVNDLTEDNIKSEKFIKLIEEANEINTSISDIIAVITGNRDSFNSIQKTSHAIAIADTLFMADMFFRNYLPAKYEGYNSRWKGIIAKILNATTEIMRPAVGPVRKVALGATLGSLPLYFWLDDQAKAHLQIALENNYLLKDLQTLLMEVTETLVSDSLIKNSSSDLFDGRTKVELEKYLVSIDERLEGLRKYLSSTQEESSDLLESRIYRWSSIFNDYAPWGIGTMFGWKLSRNLLFKGTGGIVTRMIDPTASIMLRFSFLLWFYTSQRDTHHENIITLTTQDFFTFYNIYQATLVEKDMVLELLSSKNEDRAYSKELAINSINTTLKSNTFLEQMGQYRKKLLELVNGKKE